MSKEVIATNSGIPERRHLDDPGWIATRTLRKYYRRVTQRPAGRSPGRFLSQDESNLMTPKAALLKAVASVHDTIETATEDFSAYIAMAEDLGLINDNDEEFFELDMIEGGPFEDDPEDSLKKIVSNLTDVLGIALDRCRQLVERAEKLP